MARSGAKRREFSTHVAWRTQITVAGSEEGEVLAVQYAGGDIVAWAEKMMITLCVMIANNRECMIP